MIVVLFVEIEYNYDYEYVMDVVIYTDYQEIKFKNKTLYWGL